VKDDRDVAVTSKKPVAQWPDPPAAEAYYGLAGHIVAAIAPHTNPIRWPC